MRSSPAPGGISYDYDLSYPKCEFLAYLRREHDAVFHGSNDAEIEVLEPHQASGTGPNQDLLAVYATEDPTNATFIAILDRSHLTYWDVSLSNERYAVGLQEGAPPPWREGVVYILDGGPFEKRGNRVCFEAVRPLGKLRVVAGDLPNLDRIEVGTTREENDAFHLVLELVEEVADRERFRTRRDSGGYSFLWRDEDREQVLCRCYFDGSKKQVGLFDSEGDEERVPIEEVEDLRQHASALRTTAARWA